MSKHKIPSNHHQTFRLSLEHIDEPSMDLKKMCLLLQKQTQQLFFVNPIKC
ncbi:hypothetical protein [Legionella cincinnatiensis]|uniref:hypothetical protein n=1 Tax=Legionella cincinnatiensis TaxID=28085 RepID=UPI000A4FBAA2|nr:hypothetical protein [Legionella cincinnatiensis]